MISISKIKKDRLLFLVRQRYRCWSRRMDKFPVTVLGPYKIGDNSVIGANLEKTRIYPLIQYTVESLPAY